MCIKYIRYRICYVCICIVLCKSIHMLLCTWYNLYIFVFIWRYHSYHYSSCYHHYCITHPQKISLPKKHFSSSHPFPTNETELGAIISIPSGQIITTSAEVTLNGGLVRESPQNPLNSGLGKFRNYTTICPDPIIRFFLGGACRQARQDKNVVRCKKLRRGFEHSRAIRMGGCRWPMGIGPHGWDG